MSAAAATKPESSIDVWCWRCDKRRTVDIQVLQTIPGVGPWVWGCKCCKAENQLSRIQARRLTHGLPRQGPQRPQGYRAGVG